VRSRPLVGERFYLVKWKGFDSIQRKQIRQLRDRIEQLEGGRPASAISSRPGSRERLPPMEGLPGEVMPMGLEGTERPGSARSRGSRPGSAGGPEVEA
jgi:hypothetical protein